MSVDTDVLGHTVGHLRLSQRSYGQQLFPKENTDLVFLDVSDGVRKQIIYNHVTDEIIYDSGESILPMSHNSTKISPDGKLVTARIGGGLFRTVNTETSEVNEMPVRPLYGVISEDAKRILYYDELDVTGEVVIYYDMEKQVELKRFYSNKLPAELKILESLVVGTSSYTGSPSNNSAHINEVNSLIKIDEDYIDFKYYNSNDRCIKHAIFDINNEAVVKDDYLFDYDPVDSTVLREQFQLGTVAELFEVREYRDVDNRSRNVSPARNSVRDIQIINNNKMLITLGTWAITPSNHYDPGIVWHDIWCEILIDKSSGQWLAYSTHLNNHASGSTSKNYYPTVGLSSNGAYMLAHQKATTKFGEFVVPIEQGDRDLLYINTVTGELDAYFDTGPEESSGSPWRKGFALSPDDKYVLKNYDDGIKTFNSGLIPVYVDVLEKDFPSITFNAYSEKVGGYVDRVEISINGVLVETVQQPTEAITYTLKLSELNTGDNQLEIKAIDESGAEASVSETIQFDGVPAPPEGSYIIVEGQHLEVVALTENEGEVEVTLDKPLESNITEFDLIEMIDDNHKVLVEINGEWVELEHVHTQYKGDKAIDRFQTENQTGFETVKTKIESTRKGDNVFSYIERPRQTFRYKEDLTND